MLKSAFWLRKQSIPGITSLICKRSVLSTLAKLHSCIPLYLPSQFPIGLS